MGVRGVAFGVVLLVALSAGLWADGPQQPQESLKNSVRARLIFETDALHPSHLRVYLRLTELTDALDQWLADPAGGVKAEVLNGKGVPVGEAPGLRNLALVSEPILLSLPGGSRLDLLISKDWGFDDPAGGYVLSVADRVWFLPRSELGSYTLRIKFPGVFPSPAKPSKVPTKPWILFEIPDQKIVISPPG